MSRESSKDLYEKIGIIAIVVSLAVVAYEVRQNTNAIRSTVVQSISQQSFDAVALSIDNTDVRDALYASASGNATPEQKRLVDLVYAALLRIQLNRYLQSEIGVIDRDTVLKIGGSGGGSIYQRSDFLDFWERTKNEYDTDFQAYMTKFVLNQEAALGRK